MTETFYKDMSGFKTFAEFANPKYYQELPEDWLVALTDVKGSTKAIQAGQYKNVNALGVASIVALLKTLQPIEVPYVFGGDGATVCFPASKKESVVTCFGSIHELAKSQFNLEMRTGIVAISDLKKLNKKVLVAKYLASKAYHQAMFLGDGLACAEALIKENEAYQIKAEHVKSNDLFNGFECRWKEIPSPQGETIALLVQTRNSIVNKAPIYDKIIKKIEEIYGQEKRHHPITNENLNLNGNIFNKSPEILIRTFKKNFVSKLLYRISLLVTIYLGKYLMKNKVKLENADWGAYKETMIQNTDYRKFDEVLRMIISGNENQRIALREYLEVLKNKNEIVYGIHAAKNALITCMIFDYQENHIHFLDAADGGYAIAAKELKAQLKVSDKQEY